MVVLACLAVAVIAAALAYPLLLARLARTARGDGHPLERMEQPRTVTVVIAVRNGEEYIAEKLRSILNSNYPQELLDVVVVSDGSADRTEEIVRSLASPVVELIALPAGGKASALNAGIRRARGEVLVLTDARQILSPECIGLLVAALERPGIGVVSAELVILPGETQSEADVRLYWQYDAWMRKMLSRIHSTFGANGPCYAVRRELAVPIPEDCILDDVYLPLAGYFRGYRIVLEDRAKVFDYPLTATVEFWRKTRTLAGLYQILRFYPRLLLPVHPMWFHFFSYKFLRLFLPHALLLSLVSSFLLPGLWAPLAVAGHLALYSSALLDFLIPDKWLLKKLTSPARTLIVFMAAAFCAQLIFFVKPRRLWRITKIKATQPG